jgi:hypothetical protein
MTGASRLAPSNGGGQVSEVDPDGSIYLNPDAAADQAWLRENGNGRVANCYGHPAASHLSLVG